MIIRYEEMENYNFKKKKKEWSPQHKEIAERIGCKMQ